MEGRGQDGDLGAREASTQVLIGLAAQGRGVRGGLPAQVGGALGELLFEALDRRCEGAQALETLRTTGGFHLGQEPVTHPIAGVVRTGVRCVLAPLEARIAQDAADLLASHGQQGADGGQGRALGRGADAALSQESRKAREGAAPQPALQEGLEGVVLVMAGQDGRDPGLAGFLGQGAVAQFACAGLEIGCVAVQLDAAAGEGDAEAGAQSGAERRIALGGISSESMVDVDGQDLRSRLGTGDQMQEEDRIGSAGEGHDDGLSRPQSRRAGELGPAGSPGEGLPTRGPGRGPMVGRVPEGRVV